MTLPTPNICTKAHGEEQNRTVTIAAKNSYNNNNITNPYPNIEQDPYSGMYSDLKHKAYEQHHNQPTNPKFAASSTQHYSAGSRVLSDASGASTFPPLGLGIAPPSPEAPNMRKHRFMSAFKGDHRSPPCVPSSRGTRQSHNTGSSSTVSRPK